MLHSVSQVSPSAAMETVPRLICFITECFPISGVPQCCHGNSAKVHLLHHRMFSPSVAMETVPCWSASSQNVFPSLVSPSVAMETVPRFICFITECFPPVLPWKQCHVGLLHHRMFSHLWCLPVPPEARGVYLLSEYCKNKASALHPGMS